MLFESWYSYFKLLNIEEKIIFNLSSLHSNIIFEKFFNFIKYSIKLFVFSDLFISFSFCNIGKIDLNNSWISSFLQYE